MHIYRRSIDVPHSKCALPSRKGATETTGFDAPCLESDIQSKHHVEVWDAELKLVREAELELVVPTNRLRPPRPSEGFHARRHS